MFIRFFSFSFFVEISVARILRFLSFSPSSICYAGDSFVVERQAGTDVPVDTTVRSEKRMLYD